MSIRIDKYIWAIRLFKTRSIAAEAIKKGRILIKGVTVKPSRNIEIGEEFEVKMPMVVRKFRVKQLLQHRVGAKLVADYIVEITSKEQLASYELYKEQSKQGRDRGTGRPTKKERRDMDDLFDEWANWEIDDDSDETNTEN
ncbi:MAG: hypothetical protein RIS47_206 [Bacteroidota bacterium]|jgi:ribosome-associated heat shock protein Hsp15